jgi:hypothetical protein
MLSAGLVALTHVLVHCMCILVIAKKQLLLLPLKPLFKLGLWGQEVCEEQAYTLI